MWRTKIILAIAIVGAFSAAAEAQFGNGIRGTGGLQSNGIGGSGGLRGNSVLGSGGLRANGILGSGGLPGLNPNLTPGGASFGTYGVTSRPYGAFTNRGTGGGGGGRGNKPFSGFSSQPTVSPYLNLFRNDLSGQSDFNYQTLVRPQLQQRQVNSQLQGQDNAAARRLQSIAAQADFNPAGAKDEAPTGHQTVYNYLSHYYSTPPRRQKPGR